MQLSLLLSLLFLPAMRSQQLLQSDTAAAYPTVASIATQFGHSVAMSFDGSRVIGGAISDDVVGSDAGSAYIFDYTGGDFTLVDILYPTNGSGPAVFGFSVALSGNGSRAVVGAPGAFGGGGVVYVFTQLAGASNFTLTQTIYPTNASGYGSAVGIISDGARLFVGATTDDTVGLNSGAVHILDDEGGNFTQTQVVYPNVSGGRFGTSVAIAHETGRFLVGSPTETDGGAAYLFEPSFAPLGKLYPTVVTGTPRFGHSVALSADGTRAAVGAYFDNTVGVNMGRVYIFDTPAGTLVESLLPVDDSGNTRFGISIAMAWDGTRVVVGATGDDTAYLYAGSAPVFDKQRQTDNNFTLVDTLYPTTITDGPEFGNSVSISGDGSRVLVGASFDDTAGADDGAVFWFALTTIIDDPIEVSTDDPLVITGDLDISPNATVTITVTGAGTPAIIVTGCVSFGGTLVLDLDQAQEGQEDVLVATYGSLCTNYTPFTQVLTTGTDECASADTSSTYGATSFEVLVDVDSANCNKDDHANDDRVIIGAVVGALAFVAYVMCVCVFACILCALFIAAPVIGGITAKRGRKTINRMDTVQFDESDLAFIGGSDDSVD